MRAAYSVHPDRYDFAVIGAGIVGLATALALKERLPTAQIAVLEKERSVGLHQTTHNSGVIHSGLYYRPGSLKAQLCVDGARRLTGFCEAHGIAYERCGKIVVATHTGELAGLEELYRRGTANGVPGLLRVGPEELREIEPHAAGVAALHSPNTAIVDFRAVARAMAEDLQRQGTDLLTGRAVVSIKEDGRSLRVIMTDQEVKATYFINCAGLYSDVIARAMGLSLQLRIVPFRGEYYLVRPERGFLVRNLIYPVPDPKFPFLGVHFTRTIGGQVEVGPNAVLAFAREGYSRTTVQPREMLDTIFYPGFMRLARRYWRTGLAEFRRSFSKTAFTRSAQRLVPEIQEEDLVPADAGVRAQAISAAGTPVDDFAIVETSRGIHVLNTPSPAATASLAIGEHIADRAIRSGT
ncbi:MAG: L-2-hydroxyglutarate oxidase [Chloroflexota bacterium]